MEKTDLSKLYKQYYTAKATPEIIRTIPADYLSITGKGDPSGADYAHRIQALYAVAYAVKFASKALGRDFTVPKLEGLWWFDTQRFGEPDFADTPRLIPRSEWEYRMLIRLPDFVAETLIGNARQAVVTGKKLELALEVERYTMDEGEAVQILHTGPFDREPETLSLLVEFMETNKLQKNGLHHEIYLSDFRKTPPEKLKTILREPFIRK